MAGPISSTSGISAGLQALQSRSQQNKDQAELKTTSPRSSQDTEISTTSATNEDTSISNIKTVGLDVNDSLSESEAIELASNLSDAIGSGTLSIANNRLESVTSLFNQSA